MVCCFSYMIFVDWLLFVSTRHPASRGRYDTTTTKEPPENEN